MYGYARGFYVDSTNKQIPTLQPKWTYDVIQANQVNDTRFWDPGLSYISIEYIFVNIKENTYSLWYEWQRFVDDGVKPVWGMCQ